MEEKELIIQQLRDAGCRITKQRLAILDIILNQDPSCCKEIYREAVKVDKNIGSATVYRMVNTLEEIGVRSIAVHVQKTAMEQSVRMRIAVIPALVVEQIWSLHWTMERILF